MRYNSIVGEPDALEKWRQDVERREEEHAAERRERKREERRLTTVSEVATLEARVAELESADRQLRADLAGVMSAIADSFDTLSNERADFSSQIHRLETEMAKLSGEVAALREQRGADLAGVMSAITESFTTLSSEPAQTRTELHLLGTEMAKLGSEVAALREQRAKGFQFAREKGEVEDLPNPLPVAPNSLIRRAVSPQYIDQAGNRSLGLRLAELRESHSEWLS